MALTVEGRALTEAHRKGQLAIAARAAATSKILWRRLRVSDLDGSTPAWMAAQLGLMSRSYAQSESLAASYISEYRDAENAADAPIVGSPYISGAMAQSMLLAGPSRVKLLIGKGESADGAHAKAFTKFSGIVRRQVMSGGRMMINETASQDGQAIGWRRVTDGDPCTFCAMLASRGPVYVSKDSTDGSVMRMSRSGDMKLLYHGHCGCTGEIIYGDWQPSEREQLYIDEYEKAAKQADKAGESRTQDTVLWRMRENGIFRDSPLSRNK